MSRMSEMSQAMQDYCNENYGPPDIPPPDEAECLQKPKQEMDRSNLSLGFEKGYYDCPECKDGEKECICGGP